MKINCCCTFVERNIVLNQSLYNIPNTKLCIQLFQKVIFYYRNYFLDLLNYCRYSPTLGVEIELGQLLSLATLWSYVIVGNLPFSIDLNLPVVQGTLAFRAAMFGDGAFLRGLSQE